MKSYGIDFRKRVIAYVETGHSKKETCQLFGISTNTLYLWEKQLKELGHLERQKRNVTELLRTGCFVQSVLEYYFKTK